MNIKLKRVFTSAAAACLLLCSACGGSSAVPTEAPGSPADFSIEIKLGGETYTVEEDGCHTLWGTEKGVFANAIYYNDKMPDCRIGFTIL